MHFTHPIVSKRTLKALSQTYSMAASTIKMAVLDDYQSSSTAHFSKVAPERLQITQFQDTLNPRNPADLPKLIERLKPFSIISCMRERTPFPAELLHALPNLKLLLTTGLRNLALDLKTCSELGIVVAGTDPKHNFKPTGGNDKPKRTVPDSTTTHCWALVLGLARQLARDDRIVKNGGWQGPTLATQISGKTLGLCGLGRLGSAVGRIAVQAWGMRVICWSSSLTQEKADEQAKSVGLEAGEFEAVSKEQLFSQADVLSVHYVLSDRSRWIVGKKELDWMQKSALFVNTSRGPLVDQDALLEVCRSGGISGAALDVFDVEPLPQDSQWRSTKWGEEGRAEVLLSPHMGYGETVTLDSWYAENAKNLKRWLDGEELLARLN